MSLTHSIWYSGGVVADRIVHWEGQSSWGFFGSSSNNPGALYSQNRCLRCHWNIFSSLLNIGLTLLYIKNEIPIQSDLMALIFCKFASLVNVWNVYAYSLWLFLNCCNVTLKYLFKGSVYFASEVVKLYLDPSFLLRSNQEPCLL